VSIGEGAAGIAAGQDKLRARILKGLSQVTIVVGTISWLIASYYLFQSGVLFPIATITAIYLLLLSSLFAPGVRYRLRAVSLVSVFFIIALNSFTLRGLAGAGPLWLLTSSVLAGVLLGRSAAFITVAGGAALMGAVGFAEVTGWLVWDFPEPLRIAVVLAQSADWLFLTLLATFPAALLLDSLTNSLKQESILRRAADSLNRELEVSNRALMTLNDSVSNDVRGPLRKIQLASLRLVELVPDEHQEAAADIQRTMAESIQRMEQVLSTSQQLSQVRQEDLFRQELDVVVVARQVSGQISNDQEKAIEIAAEKPLMANADFQLTTLLLQHLLKAMVKISNATDTVCISFSQLDIGGVSHIQVVSDSTSGFEYQEQFIPLYSPFNASNDQTAGIELVLIQRIIDLHGGRLSLVMQPGNIPAICFTLEEDSTSKQVQ